MSENKDNDKFNKPQIKDNYISEEVVEKNS